MDAFVSNHLEDTPDRHWTMGMQLESKRVAGTRPCRRTAFRASQIASNKDHNIAVPKRWQAVAQSDSGQATIFARRNGHTHLPFEVVFHLLSLRKASIPFKLRELLLASDLPLCQSPSSTFIPSFDLYNPRRTQITDNISSTCRSGTTASQH